ncbi:hypothetical protein EVAR_68789_1 [Eumeta japonica]|uniref:Uncharacterized protein n=1 Tax=Eumeta variegata TaxID=151549 RepID=A0A4C1ZBU3_EUMVA|nr:hypothetical protein EVAR_68789_1 [Eumeta japonica]
MAIFNCELDTKRVRDIEREGETERGWRGEERTAGLRRVSYLISWCLNLHPGAVHNAGVCRELQFIL